MNGLEVLDCATCIELLRGEHIGRLGLTVDALPAILPVDYCVLDDQIVFRTVPGTKLAAATRGAVVAFEVDHEDVETAERWSVLVVGVAHPMARRELADSEWRVDHLGPWIRREDTVPVSIALDVISGRRLVLSRAQRAAALD